MLEVVQTDENQEYDGYGKMMPPSLIKNLVNPFAIRIKNKETIERKRSDRLGDIHDITYRNINIYTDSEDIKPIIMMQTCDSERIIKNFTLENFYINGVKQENFDSFETIFQNAENITIK